MHAVGECINLSDFLLENVGIALTPYQVEYRDLMVKLALSGLPAELPIQWSRQSGKTETHVHTTIVLAIYSARWLQRDFKIAFIAPSKQEQTVVVTRDRLQGYVTRLMPWMQPFLGMTVILGEGRRTADFIFRASTGIEASIRCVSGSPKAHVKAHTFQLMFLEQVEDMDEEKMKNDIFPFGAGSEIGCLTVLAGSAAPKVINNYYYNAIQKQIKETGIKPPWFVDDALAAMYRPGYGKFVAEMKLKIGEESDAYRTQFGNEWILPRNKLIDRNLLLNLKWHAGQVQFEPRSLRAGGLDVAKSVDSSVLTYGTRLGERSYVQGWLEKEGVDYEKQGHDFAELIAAQNLQTLEIDATGPGAALADIIEARLKDIPYACPVVRFTFTPQNNNDLYVQYEKEITHSRLLYPAEECREQRRFIEQHLDVERIITRNLLNLKAPNRANAHDDYVASAALFVEALLNPSYSDLPVLTRSR